MSRKYRALNQSMYLLQANQLGENEWSFLVSGSTRNIYKIYISSSIHKCTCRDYIQRGILCKHILLIIGRVANDKQSFDLIPIDNRTNIFKINPKFSQLLIQRIKTQKNKTNKHNPNTTNNQIDSECTICFESMKNKELYTCPTCKNNFHSGCIKHWSLINYTCPLCRSPMLDINNTEDVCKFIK